MDSSLQQQADKKLLSQQQQLMLQKQLQQQQLQQQQMKQQSHQRQPQTQQLQQPLLLTQPQSQQQQVTKQQLQQRKQGLLQQRILQQDHLKQQQSLKERQQKQEQVLFELLQLQDNNEDNDGVQEDRLTVQQQQQRPQLIQQQQQLHLQQQQRQQKEQQQQLQALQQKYGQSLQQTQVIQQPQMVQQFQVVQPSQIVHQSQFVQQSQSQLTQHQTQDTQQSLLVQQPQIVNKTQFVQQSQILQQPQQIQHTQIIPQTQLVQQPQTVQQQQQNQYTTITTQQQTKKQPPHTQQLLQQQLQQLLLKNNKNYSQRIVVLGNQSQHQQQSVTHQPRVVSNSTIGQQQILPQQMQCVVVSGTGQQQQAQQLQRVVVTGNVQQQQQQQQQQQIQRVVVANTGQQQPQQIQRVVVGASSQTQQQQVQQMQQIVVPSTTHQSQQMPNIVTSVSIQQPHQIQRVVVTSTSSQPQQQYAQHHTPSTQRIVISQMKTSQQTQVQSPPQCGIVVGSLQQQDIQRSIATKQQQQRVVIAGQQLLRLPQQQQSSQQVKLQQQVTHQLLQPKQQQQCVVNTHTPHQQESPQCVVINQVHQQQTNVQKSDNNLVQQLHVKQSHQQLQQFHMQTSQKQSKLQQQQQELKQPQQQQLKQQQQLQQKIQQVEQPYHSGIIVGKLQQPLKPEPEQLQKKQQLQRLKLQDLLEHQQRQKQQEEILQKKQTKTNIHKQQQQKKNQQLREQVLLQQHLKQQQQQKLHQIKQQVSPKNRISFVIGNSQDNKQKNTVETINHCDKPPIPEPLQFMGNILVGDQQLRHGIKRHNDDIIVIDDEPIIFSSSDEDEDNDMVRKQRSLLLEAERLVQERYIALTIALGPKYQIYYDDILRSWLDGRLSRDEFDRNILKLLSESLVIKTNDNNSNNGDTSVISIDASNKLPSVSSIVNKAKTSIATSASKSKKKKTDNVKRKETADSLADCVPLHNALVSSLVEWIPLNSQRLKQHAVRARGITETGYPLQLYTYADVPQVRGIGDYWYDKEPGSLARWYWPNKLPSSSLLKTGEKTLKESFQEQEKKEARDTAIASILLRPPSRNMLPLLLRMDENTKVEQTIHLKQWIKNYCATPDIELTNVLQNKCLEEKYQLATMIQMRDGYNKLLNELKIRDNELSSQEYCLMKRFHRLKNRMTKRRRQVLAVFKIRQIELQDRIHRYFNRSWLKRPDDQVKRKLLKEATINIDDDDTDEDDEDEKENPQYRFLKQHWERVRQLEETRNKQHLLKTKNTNSSHRQIGQDQWSQSTVLTIRFLRDRQRIQATRRLLHSIREERLSVKKHTDRVREFQHKHCPCGISDNRPCKYRNQIRRFHKQLRKHELNSIKTQVDQKLTEETVQRECRKVVESNKTIVEAIKKEEKVKSKIVNTRKVTKPKKKKFKKANKKVNTLVNCKKNLTLTKNTIFNNAITTNLNCSSMVTNTNGEISQNLNNINPVIVTGNQDVTDSYKLLIDKSSSLMSLDGQNLRKMDRRSTVDISAAADRVVKAALAASRQSQLGKISKLLSDDEKILADQDRLASELMPPPPPPPPLPKIVTTPRNPTVGARYLQQQQLLLDRHRQLERMRQEEDERRQRAKNVCRQLQQEIGDEEEEIYISTTMSTENEEVHSMFSQQMPTKQHDIQSLTIQPNIKYEQAVLDHKVQYEEKRQQNNYNFYYGKGDYYLSDDEMSGSPPTELFPLLLHDLIEDEISESSPTKSFPPFVHDCTEDERSGSLPKESFSPILYDITDNEMSGSSPTKSFTPLVHDLTEDEMSGSSPTKSFIPLVHDLTEDEMSGSSPTKSFTPLVHDLTEDEMSGSLPKESFPPILFDITEDEMSGSSPTTKSFPSFVHDRTEDKMSGSSPKKSFSPILYDITDDEMSGSSPTKSFPPLVHDLTEDQLSQLTNRITTKPMPSLSIRKLTSSIPLQHPELKISASDHKTKHEKDEEITQGNLEPISDNPIINQLIKEGKLVTVPPPSPPLPSLKPLSGSEDLTISTQCQYILSTIKKNVHKQIKRDNFKQSKLKKQGVHKSNDLVNIQQSKTSKQHLPNKKYKAKRIQHVKKKSLNNSKVSKQLSKVKNNSVKINCLPQTKLKSKLKGNLVALKNQDSYQSELSAATVDKSSIEQASMYISGQQEHNKNKEKTVIQIENELPSLEKIDKLETESNLKDLKCMQQKAPLTQLNKQNLVCEVDKNNVHIVKEKVNTKSKHSTVCSDLNIECPKLVHKKADNHKCTEMNKLMHEYRDLLETLPPAHKLLLMLKFQLQMKASTSFENVTNNSNSTFEQEFRKHLSFLLTLTDEQNKSISLLPSTINDKQKQAIKEKIRCMLSHLDQQQKEIHKSVVANNDDVSRTNVAFDKCDTQNVKVAENLNNYCDISLAYKNKPNDKNNLIDDQEQLRLTRELINQYYSIGNSYVNKLEQKQQLGQYGREHLDRDKIMSQRLLIEKILHSELTDNQNLNVQQTNSLQRQKWFNQIKRFESITQLEKQKQLCEKQKEQMDQQKQPKHQVWQKQSFERRCENLNLQHGSQCNWRLAKLSTSSLKGFDTRLPLREQLLHRMIAGKFVYNLLLNNKKQMNQFTFPTKDLADFKPKFLITESANKIDPRKRQNRGSSHWWKKIGIQWQISPLVDAKKPKKLRNQELKTVITLPFANQVQRTKPQIRRSKAKVFINTQPQTTTNLSTFDETKKLKKFLAPHLLKLMTETEAKWLEQLQAEMLNLDQRVNLHWKAMKEKQQQQVKLLMEYGKQQGQKNKCQRQEKQNQQEIKQRLLDSFVNNKQQHNSQIIPQGQKMEQHTLPMLIERDQLKLPLKTKLIITDPQQDVSKQWKQLDVIRVEHQNRWKSRLQQLFEVKLTNKMFFQELYERFIKLQESLGIELKKQPNIHAALKQVEYQPLKSIERLKLLKQLQLKKPPNVEEELQKHVQPHQIIINQKKQPQKLSLHNNIPQKSKEEEQQQSIPQKLIKQNSNLPKQISKTLENQQQEQPLQKLTVQQKNIQFPQQLNKPLHNMQFTHQIKKLDKENNKHIQEDQQHLNNQKLQNLQQQEQVTQIGVHSCETVKSQSAMVMNLRHLLNLQNQILNAQSQWDKRSQLHPLIFTEGTFSQPQIKQNISIKCILQKLTFLLHNQRIVLQRQFDRLNEQYINTQTNQTNLLVPDKSITSIKNPCTTVMLLPTQQSSLTMKQLSNSPVILSPQEQPLTPLAILTDYQPPLQEHQKLLKEKCQVLEQRLDKVLIQLKPLMELWQILIRFPGRWIRRQLDDIEQTIRKQMSISATVKSRRLKLLKRQNGGHQVSIESTAKMQRLWQQFQRICEYLVWRQQRIRELIVELPTVMCQEQHSILSITEDSQTLPHPSSYSVLLKLQQPATTKHNFSKYSAILKLEQPSMLKLQPMTYSVMLKLEKSAKSNQPSSNYSALLKLQRLSEPKQQSSIFKPKQLNTSLVPLTQQQNSKQLSMYSMTLKPNQLSILKLKSLTSSLTLTPHKSLTEQQQSLLMTKSTVMQQQPIPISINNKQQQKLQDTKLLSNDNEENNLSTFLKSTSNKRPNSPCDPINLKKICLLQSKHNSKTKKPETNYVSDDINTVIISSDCDEDTQILKSKESSSKNVQIFDKSELITPTVDVNPHFKPKILKSCRPDDKNNIIILDSDEENKTMNLEATQILDKSKLTTQSINIKPQQFLVSKDIQNNSLQDYNITRLAIKENTNKNNKDNNKKLQKKNKITSNIDQNISLAEFKIPEIAVNTTILSRPTQLTITINRPNNTSPNVSKTTNSIAVNIKPIRVAIVECSSLADITIDNSSVNVVPDGYESVKMVAVIRWPTKTANINPMMAVIKRLIEIASTISQRKSMEITNNCNVKSFNKPLLENINTSIGEKETTKIKHLHNNTKIKKLKDIKKKPVILTNYQSSCKNPICEKTVQRHRRLIRTVTVDTTGPAVPIFCDRGFLDGTTEQAVHNRFVTTIMAMTAAHSIVSYIPSRQSNMSLHNTNVKQYNNILCMTDNYKTSNEPYLKNDKVTVSTNTPLQLSSVMDLLENLENRYDDLGCSNLHLWSGCARTTGSPIVAAAKMAKEQVAMFRKRSVSMEETEMLLASSSTDKSSKDCLDEIVIRPLCERTPPSTLTSINNKDESVRTKRPASVAFIKSPPSSIKNIPLVTSVSSSVAGIHKKSKTDVGMIDNIVRKSNSEIRPIKRSASMAFSSSLLSPSEMTIKTNALVIPAVSSEKLGAGMSPPETRKSKRSKSTNSYSSTSPRALRSSKRSKSTTCSKTNSSIENLSTPVKKSSAVVKSKNKSNPVILTPTTLTSKSPIFSTTTGKVDYSKSSKSEIQMSDIKKSPANVVETTPTMAITQKPSIISAKVSSVSNNIIDEGVTEPAAPVTGINDNVNTTTITEEETRTVTVTRTRSKTIPAPMDVTADACSLVVSACEQFIRAMVIERQTKAGRGAGTLELRRRDAFAAAMAVDEDIQPSPEYCRTSSIAVDTTSDYPQTTTNVDRSQKMWPEYKLSNPEITLMDSCYNKDKLKEQPQLTFIGDNKMNPSSVLMVKTVVETQTTTTTTTTTTMVKGDQCSTTKTTSAVKTNPLAQLVSIPNVSASQTTLNNTMTSIKPIIISENTPVVDNNKPSERKKKPQTNKNSTIVKQLSIDNEISLKSSINKTLKNRKSSQTSKLPIVKSRDSTTKVVVSKTLPITETNYPAPATVTSPAAACGFYVQRGRPLLRPTFHRRNPFGTLANTCALAAAELTVENDMTYNYFDEHSEESEDEDRGEENHEVDAHTTSWDCYFGDPRCLPPVSRLNNFLASGSVPSKAPLKTVDVKRRWRQPGGLADDNDQESLLVHQRQQLIAEIACQQEKRNVLEQDMERRIQEFRERPLDTQEEYYRKFLKLQYGSEDATPMLPELPPRSPTHCIWRQDKRSWF